MRTRWWNRFPNGNGIIRVAALLTLSLSLIAPQVLPQVTPQNPDPWAMPAAQGVSAIQLPSLFLPNKGQWDERVGFVAAFGAAVVRAETGAVSFLVTGRSETGACVNQHVVRFVFEGCREDARPEGGAAAPGVHHLLIGRDRSSWHRDLPGYGSIVYRDLYPGVDLRLRYTGSRLEMSMTATEEAPRQEFVLRIDGVEPGDVREADDVVWIDTSVGPIRLEAAVVATATTTDASRRVRLLGGTRIGLVLPSIASEGTESVVLSTYFGGSVGEIITAVATDEQGFVTVAGYTSSQDFPITPGAFDDIFDDQFFPKTEGFVSRLDPALGQLVFSTFIGGSRVDRLLGLAILPSGEIVVAGCTGSLDYPVSPNAFDKTVSIADACITRLSADGSDLIYSTILGGDDFGGVSLKDMDVDDTGAVIVVGVTDTGDFPTTPGAYQEQPPVQTSSPINAFVSKLDPTLSSLEFSTYLGGGAIDTAYGVKFTSSGSVAVVGRTGSIDFPTTLGAYDDTYNTLGDGFVSLLSSDGRTLEASTFLGGSKIDEAHALDLAPDGSLIVVGLTTSLDFPTTPDAFDGAGAFDAFVARFDATLSTLVYSTYLGGGQIEQGPFRVVVGPSGAVTVAGATRAADFPVTPGAFQLTNPTSPTVAAWVTRFHPSMHSLLYSTYLGGSDDELLSLNEPMGLTVDNMGNVVIAGDTTSTDFPTTAGVFMENPLGSHSGFITKLPMLPDGAVKYGTSTPGPAGPLAIGVGNQPQVGNTRFTITCSNAPPNAEGYLAISLASLTVPIPLAGAQAWIDPDAVAFILRPTSDAWGWSEILLPIPAVPALAGFSVFAQTFWPVQPLGQLAASNALALTLVP